MKLKKLLFLLLLLLLPLDAQDWLRVSVGSLRLSIHDLLLVLILYLDFLEGTVTRSRTPPFARKVCWLAVACAVCSSLSLFYVPLDLMGFDLRFSLNLLLLALLVYLTPRLIRDPGFLRLSLGALILSIVVLSTGTILKSLGVPIPGGTRTQLAGHLGPFRMGVTALAEIGTGFNFTMLTAIPLVLSRKLVRSSALRVLLALGLVFAAVLPGSRYLWLAVGVEIGALLLLALKLGGARGRLAAGSVLFLGAGVLLVQGRDLYAALVRLRPDTVMQRLDALRFGFELASESPLKLLFGTGKGFFVSSFHDGMVLHNFLVDMLVSKGLTTLLLFVALIGLLLWRLLKLVWLGEAAGLDDDSRQLAGLLLVAMVGCLVGGLFVPLISSLAFMMLLALASAVIALAEPAADTKGEP